MTKEDYDIESARLLIYCWTILNKGDVPVSLYPEEDMLHEISSTNFLSRDAAAYDYLSFFIYNLKDI